MEILISSTIISGILVMLASSPIVSVLLFISVLIQSAGYLLLLGINFIGLTYLVVYVGAIAILFLFVIMMMDTGYSKQWNKNSSDIVLIGIVLSMISVVIRNEETTLEFTSQCNKVSGIQQIESISEGLYIVYPLYVIIISMILVLAVWGPIILCKHD